MLTTRRAAVVMILLTVMAACSPSTPSERSTAPGADSSRPGGPKRISVVIRGNPFALAQAINAGGAGTVPGIDQVEVLLHTGLSVEDGQGRLRPRLAEAVPSQENGLWRVEPDGRMETRWHLNPNLVWQDGSPFTADDLLFTVQVVQEPTVELARTTAYELIDRAEVPDPRTLVVYWSKPFIKADALFSTVANSNQRVMPMPRHLLEADFRQDPTTFTQLPYWTRAFVGLGPFRVVDYVEGSHMVVRASDTYVLGRPRIDEIEVKFIPDNNALLANVLSGVDLTLGKTISLDMALQARDQWKDGHVETLPQNWTPINPQFMNPDPPIIADLRFRKAMILALDRQQLADFVFSGHASVAHSYVSPSVPLYDRIEPSIVKYPYDPKQAEQILDELGYAKGPDGMRADGVGRKLAVEIRIPLQNDIHAKTAAPVADAWQRIGVAVEQTPVPIQRALDREWRNTYPGFEIVERRNSLLVGEIWRFHTSQIPLPENGFRATGYGGRYANPEVDAALERYVTTIPLPERMQALAALVHHQTSNLSQLPLFFGVDPTLISNRLANVTARGDAFTQAWNVQEWDLRP